MSTNPLREGLFHDRTGDACAVVIFGASGDLTKRKLLPALYNLAIGRFLSGGFAVVGVARREKSNESFRAEMKEGVSRFSRRKPVDEAVWGDFEKAISYVRGSFEDPKTYADLKAHLDQIDAERAFKRDPELKELKAYVDDSGEGRWTVNEAVAHAVPAPTIAASLFARFSSRQENSFALRVLAALRNEFGGHAVKKA